MNSAELKAAIARTNITYRAIAARLGISEQAFYNKMNGKTEFKNSEIVKLTDMLSLNQNAVNLIFFNGMVN